MKKGLVSIISPCYNGGKFIHRLLDSVLGQDYPTIEMFVIDDGSTDNTKQVIESYIPKFKEKGYKLTYIYQKNAGQAAAVNRALKLITGEYLTWPDSDDYYTKINAISSFIERFQKVDDSYGAVCFIGKFVDEVTHKDLGWKLNVNQSEDLFKKYLFGGGVLEVPINYMIRVSALDTAIPTREIYYGRQPQNLQLFLPLFYYYKCCTIKEPVCNIVVRQNSHSHTLKSYEGYLDDIQGYIDIHTNTLNRMQSLSEKERTDYIHIVNLRFLNDKLTLALNFDRCKDARIFARKLRLEGVTLSKGKRIKLILSYCPPMLKIAKWFQKKYNINGVS